jgi:acyl-CoA synthetase (AMP-forming)/AMP-acid ligase II
MAGAPVSPELHKLILSVAPNAETMVPYGATEALPAANMTGEELTDAVAEKIKNGQGYCVGRPITSINIYIIKPVDKKLSSWDEVTLLPAGETGEIVIEGDIVTPEYFNLPEFTALSKIRRGNKILHRMGDVGFFDETGYLWFKGRKAHRVFTENGILYPVCCEAIFNRHPQVKRSALIGIGEYNKEIPVIVIEPEDGFLPVKEFQRKKFIEELTELAAEYEFTSGIKKFLFYTPFPVDIRHNAKIFREKLKIWAMKYRHYIEE